MFPSGKVTIYRFDSPCGRHCYVGRAHNFPERIKEHRNENGDTAISRHCRECPECDHARSQSMRSVWFGCFTDLGSATGERQIRELETEYINVACKEYIRGLSNRSPLNERVEVGDGSLLLAARKLYEARDAQGSLESAEQERDDLRQERDNLRNENDALTCQLSALLSSLASVERELDDARDLINQLYEAQQGHHELQNRLEDSEQEQARLRDENDALTRQLIEVQERYRASEGRLASVERELGEKNRIIKLERKFSVAEEIHRRAHPRRNFLFGILVTIVAVAAGVSFIAIANPDVREQVRELLFPPPQDVSTPSTVPFSSPLPMVAPRPAVKVTYTPTPLSTATLSPTGTPQSSPTPHLRNAIFDSAIVRACPRMDCDILARLARDSNVTVMDEVQGETYRDSALWYLIDLPEGGDDAYIHSSLLGPPASASDS